MLALALIVYCIDEAFNTAVYSPLKRSCIPIKGPKALIKYIQSIKEKQSRHV